MPDEICREAGHLRQFVSQHADILRVMALRLTPYVGRPEELVQVDVDARAQCVVVVSAMPMHFPALYTTLAAETDMPGGRQVCCVEVVRRQLEG